MHGANGYCPPEWQMPQMDRHGMAGVYPETFYRRESDVKSHYMYMMPPHPGMVPRPGMPHSTSMPCSPHEMYSMHAMQPAMMHGMAVIPPPPPPSDMYMYHAPMYPSNQWGVPAHIATHSPYAYRWGYQNLQNPQSGRPAYVADNKAGRQYAEARIQELQEVTANVNTTQGGESLVFSQHIK